jgi:Na+/citrate or Na+/malate symporter
MLLVLVVGVLPFALMTASLAREISVVYQHIDSGDWSPARYLRGLFDALLTWMTALLGSVGVAVFGINDFIMGPTVAAMFIAIWHLSTTAQPNQHGRLG